MNKMMERIDFYKKPKLLKEAFLFAFILPCLSCSNSFPSLLKQIQNKFKASSRWSCEKEDLFLLKSLSEEELEKALETCLKQKSPRLALFILERQIEKSRDIKKTKEGELKSAELAFYQLKDYEKALKYFHRLLKKPLKPGEKFFIQYHIAESYFYLQKYSQAQREIGKSFSKGLSLSDRKKAWALKARIFMAGKDFEPAIELFQSQIKKFPEEESFFREYLALIYESKNDFFSAIEELEKIKSQNSFIRQKIQRLRERQNNQPGF